MSEKSEEKKGVEVQKGKPPAPTRAINALIGEEEQNEKQKKEQKERNRERAPNPAALDYSVASYDPQGSYGEPILLTTQAHRRDKLSLIFINFS